jgi:hypothetical protein
LHNTNLNAAVVINGSNITLQGDGPGSIIEQGGYFEVVHKEKGTVPWTVPILFQFGIGLDTRFPSIQFPELGIGNILVKDLTFRGDISPRQMPTTSGPTGELYPANNSAVTNLSASGTGALLGFAGTPQCYAKNIRIVNCTFEDANKSSAVFPAFVDDISYENCRFAACKDYISGWRVRAAATKNVSIGDENEFMNLTQDYAPDLWAEDFADGVGLNTGDNVLLLNETDRSANGIYIVDEYYNWRPLPLPPRGANPIKFDIGAAEKISDQCIRVEAKVEDSNFLEEHFFPE